MLSGKLNPQYVPYIDMGDHVIVINAEKVRLTGLKARASSIAAIRVSLAGCARSRLSACLNRKPEAILEQAIKGMLPKSKLGRADGFQAEGLSRRQASPPGAGAGGDGNQVRAG